MNPFGVLGFATAVCGYLALAVTAEVNDVGVRPVATHSAQAPTLAVDVAIVRVAIAMLRSARWPSSSP
ncbi:MAG TPA: hypothetical protein VHE78_05175 [Gemmatimonadaceae bacterium]|nr:hypothetical protein [Gemmatimonadaceae bacterium]